MNIPGRRDHQGRKLNTVIKEVRVCIIIVKKARQEEEFVPWFKKFQLFFEVLLVTWLFMTVLEADGNFSIPIFGLYSHRGLGLSGSVRLEREGGLIRT
jgi:hypothetical protein